MVKGLGSFLIFLLFLVISSSRVWALTFPPPRGHVNDFAGILNESTRTALEGSLTRLEEETGVEVAVVTVESLEGVTIEDYTVRLFESWKIGKKDRDNGVLLLVAPKERQVRIEVGYGLEPVLTDARAGRIIRGEIVPVFKQGNYDEGIRRGAAAVAQAVRGGVVVKEEKLPEKLPLPLPALVIGGLIFLEYLGAFLGRSKAIWPGAVLGGIGGLVVWTLVGTPVWLLAAPFGMGVVGLVLDYVLSRNYRQRKKRGLPTSWPRSWGGFAGGSRRSGGFGGFGGGASGGGGASARW